MSESDTRDEGKKGVDWSKATDEKLDQYIADATAEKRRRNPMTDHDGVDLVGVSDTEFSRKSHKILNDWCAYNRDQRIVREHAELEARRKAREARESGNE